MRVLAGIVNWAPRACRCTTCGRGGPSTWPSTGAGSSRRCSAATPPRWPAHPHCAAGVPAGQQPYQHDPDQARDLLTTAGWPAGRELRLTAPADLEAVAGGWPRTSPPRSDSSRPDPDPGRPAAGRPARPGREGATLPFDVLVHAWIDLSRTRRRRSCTASSSPARAPSGSAPDPGVRRTAGAVRRRHRPTVVTELTTDLDRFAYDQA